MRIFIISSEYSQTFHSGSILFRIVSSFSFLPSVSRGVFVFEWYPLHRASQLRLFEVLRLSHERSHLHRWRLGSRSQTVLLGYVLWVFHRYDFRTYEPENDDTWLRRHQLVPLLRGYQDRRYHLLGNEVVHSGGSHIQMRVISDHHRNLLRVLPSGFHNEERHDLRRDRFDFWILIYALVRVPWDFRCIRSE